MQISTAQPLQRAAQLGAPIDQLATQLMAVSRHTDEPTVSAALAAAAAGIRATHARLQADLLLLADQPTQRTGLPSAPVVTIGALGIDRPAHTVFLDGRRLPISATEFSLLSVLASQPERLFSKAELYRAVWESTYTGSRSRTLDSHLCRLRSKLGGRPWIANRWGQGYSLLPASPVLTEVGSDNG
ncbi:MAG: two-component system, OmpR family, phosphate regulon response regulator PhoB [Baekduia sp.]|jgi:DNA-binding response OmpR family regulator|nr:two-component system, OmpR family, phosphate regulon response regulator PhoB [Baekduia sp.]